MTPLEAREMALEILHRAEAERMAVIEARDNLELDPQTLRREIDRLWSLVHYIAKHTLRLEEDEVLQIDEAGKVSIVKKPGIAGLTDKVLDDMLRNTKGETQ